MPARSGARLLLAASPAGDVSLGATSLATVMQMVANGYGITLLPRVAADVEVRDERVKLLRFAAPASGPRRSASPGGAPRRARRISSRSARLIAETLGMSESKPRQR